MAETEITLAKLDVPVAPEDAGRIVDAIVDLFSPVTELTGALGDQVRLLRIRSALRTLEETNKLAKAAGVTLKQPPLKFLKSFLEEASLEDFDEEPNLLKLWSNLLLHAGTDGRLARRWVVDILSRMNSDDARNLETIASSDNNRKPGHIVDAAYWYDKTNIDEFVDNILGRIPEMDAIERIIKFVEVAGLVVISCGFFAIQDENLEDEIYLKHKTLNDDFDISLHSLAALGLIRFPVVITRDYKGGMFCLSLCVLTALGAEFFMSTHDVTNRPLEE